MKVRIIHVDRPNRMAGAFIVQERRWFSWEDLYFDSDKKELRQEQILGRAGITTAEFDDWDKARRYAVEYKKASKKRVILTTWGV